MVMSWPSFSPCEAMSAVSSRQERRVVVKKETIVRRSLNDPRRGRTDWARVASQTDEEIAANIAADPDAAPLLDAEWFARAKIVYTTKRAISIRLDDDVLEFFQRDGARYQTRINAVLRAYVEIHNKATAATSG